jgi:hypothetical protein
VARWGTGYVGGLVPAPRVAPAFEAARAGWAKAGRGGSPSLAAVTHFALGDAEQGRANVWDYYHITGDKGARRIAVGVVRHWRPSAGRRVSAGNARYGHGAWTER